MTTTNDLPGFLRTVADDMDNLELPPDIDSAVRRLREAAAALERAEILPGQPKADQAINLAVIEAAYGWTIDDGGALLGLINGDMGYEETGIRLDDEDLAIWRRGQSDKPPAGQPKAGHENGADALPDRLRKHADRYVAADPIAPVNMRLAKDMREAAAELERHRAASNPGIKMPAGCVCPPDSWDCNDIEPICDSYEGPMGNTFEHCWRCEHDAGCHKT